MYLRLVDGDRVAQAWIDFNLVFVLDAVAFGEAGVRRRLVVAREPRAPAGATKAIPNFFFTNKITEKTFCTRATLCLCLRRGSCRLRSPSSDRRCPGKTSRACSRWLPQQNGSQTSPSKCRSRGRTWNNELTAMALGRVLFLANLTSQSPRLARSCHCRWRLRGPSCPCTHALCCRTPRPRCRRKGSSQSKTRTLHRA